MTHREWMNEEDKAKPLTVREIAPGATTHASERYFQCDIKVTDRLIIRVQGTEQAEVLALAEQLREDE